jgi:hypothetical protein
LSNARGVTVAEVPRTQIDADLIKDITEKEGAPIPTRDLYGEPSNFHPFFTLFIMSNHTLNLGNDPDGGSTRRACVIPHNFALLLDTDREADDSIKEEIKSGRHIPVFFHMLTSLSKSLRVMRGTQLQPRPVEVEQATAVATKSSTLDDVKGTILQSITWSLKGVDAVDQKELKAVVKHQIPSVSDGVIAGVCRELFGPAKSNGKCKSIFRYKFRGKANELPVALSAVGKLILAAMTNLPEDDDDVEEDGGDDEL